MAARASRIAFSFSPLRDASPEEIVGWGQRAEGLGYEGVFIPESFNDSLTYALAVAMGTTRLIVGTAITNIYLRHPTLLAHQAAAVQEFSGGRLVLGLGVGHRVVNAQLGIDMGEPLTRMRDVITTLRTAWVKGGHQPRPKIPPPILCAALALPAVELAGELADGAIFNLFPLARYPRALSALHAGAARAGRPRDAVQVSHFTTCYVSDDRAAALREAKRMLARYANLTFYGNMLAQCGFRAEVDAVRSAMRRRDVAGAEAAVTDEMADAVTLVGNATHCRGRLRAYQMAGAERVIVFPNPVDEPRAAAVERALVALAPR